MTYCGVSKYLFACVFINTHVLAGLRILVGFLFLELTE